MTNFEILSVLVAILSVCIAFISLYRTRIIAKRQVDLQQRQVELEQESAKLAKLQREQIEAGKQFPTLTSKIYSDQTKRVKSAYGLTYIILIDNCLVDRLSAGLIPLDLRLENKVII